MINAGVAEIGIRPRSLAWQGPSGRPHEARSNPGPREMITASFRKERLHRIRLTVRLPHALKGGLAERGVLYLEPRQRP